MRSQLTKIDVSHWLVQLAGWHIYWLFYLLLEHYSFSDGLLYTILSYPMPGFLISLILKAFYSKVNFLNKSLGMIFFIIFTSSLAAQHLWFIFNLLLTAWFYSKNVFTITITARGYVWICIYGSWIMLGWSILFMIKTIAEKYKQQLLSTIQVKKLAQSKKLLMLQNQLCPHLLFNALTAIRYLIDEDEKTAKNMVTELSEFLRYSLLGYNSSLIMLKEEIKAINHYLSIEKIRHGEKLEFIFEVDDDALGSKVPRLLILPLVENSVKYGMLTSPPPVKIKINVHFDSKDDLRIEVINTGKLLYSHGNNKIISSGTGIGLENVKNRLESLFPGLYKFEITEQPGEVHSVIKIFNSRSAGHEVIS